MALTFIKNGLVEKAFSGGRGYAISETFKKQDGSDGKQKFKVWFEQATPLAEGSRVDVSGVLSAKVAEFDGDNGTIQYAELSLNKARVNGESAPAVESDPVF
jgi:hypothetical protein